MKEARYTYDLLPISRQLLLDGHGWMSREIARKAYLHISPDRVEKPGLFWWMADGVTVDRDGTWRFVTARGLAAKGAGKRLAAAKRRLYRDEDSVYRLLLRA